MVRSDQDWQGAAALADLFETEYDRITRYIGVRIGNFSHAEELAGDVFVRALERIDTFTWRGIPMQAWLFRIAHNLVVDYLRRSSRRKTTDLQEAQEIASTDDPEQEALRTLQKEEVLLAMGSLTPAQKEVVALRFFGGLSSAEVAEIMKRSNGAVRELQSTALKALRRVMSTVPATNVEVEGQRP